MKDRPTGPDVVRCNVGGDDFDDIAQAAGRALDADAPLTVVGRIYEPGNVRLYAAPRLTSGAMSTVSESLPGSPVNYEHRPITDADPMQGVIRASWVDDGGIYAEMDLTGSRVLAELAAGCGGGWSIEYSFDRAACVCGVCAASWFDAAAECTHIPGQVVEGETVYCEVVEGGANGVGCAWTHSPASHSTTTEISGGVARANTGGAYNLMAPVLARLDIIGGAAMADTQDTVAAVDAAPVDAPAMVEASALADRLANAEAENAIHRERIAQLETAQARAEGAVRASDNRARVVELARSGKVADIRRLIELRATAPAELATYDQVAALVDAVVDCANGPGVVPGQLSEYATASDNYADTKAAKDRRAIDIAKERGISFTEARRIAHNGEG